MADFEVLRELPPGTKQFADLSVLQEIQANGTAVHNPSIKK